MPRSSSLVKNLTAAFLMTSGTGRMPGMCSSFSYASIWARMFSGFKTSFSLASKTGATVSSVSSGVSVWAMQTELKKLRAVSLG